MLEYSENWKHSVIDILSSQWIFEGQMWKLAPERGRWKLISNNTNNNKNIVNIYLLVEIKKFITDEID